MSKLEDYYKDSPMPIRERVSNVIAQALLISTDPDYLTKMALDEYSLVLAETGRQITKRDSDDHRHMMLDYYYETRAEDKRQVELHRSYGKEMAAKIGQIGKDNWAAGHFLYQFVNPQGYWESSLDDVLDMFISCYALDKIFPTFLELHALLESGGYDESNSID